MATTVSESSHIESQAGGRNGIKPPKPAPSVRPPLTSLHFLIFQTIAMTEYQVFKHMSLWMSHSNQAWLGIN